MSYSVNTCVAPFCHSQDHSGGVPVAPSGMSAGLAMESSHVQFKPLGSRKAFAARHGRVRAFLAEWNSWIYQYRGENKTIPIPANWPTTIDQFIAAGLDMVDLKELLDVAMSARCKDEWRYFCGCCWTRIRQLQEHAAEIVKVVPADPPPALLSTSWTREQVDHRIDSAVRAMQADDWSPGFTKADLGKGCGHGVGCEDDLCQLTSAAALAMYIRVTDRDEAAQLFEESALLDVADVDDDEFLELVA